MLTDQLNAHATGRPVRERAGIDQVGNFLLSRLSGANGVSSNEFPKHQKQHTAETTASSYNSPKEHSSSRRKSPPVPTTVKLEQSPDHIIRSPDSHRYPACAKPVNLNSKVKELNHRHVASTLKDSKESFTSENGTDYSISEVISTGTETDITKHVIKMCPRNKVINLTAENRKPSLVVKDDVDVNLNTLDQSGQFIKCANVDSEPRLDLNHDAVQNPNGISEEDYYTPDFSIRKVNLQQSLRRMGQNEVRAKTTLRKGRSASCSPPTTTLVHSTRAEVSSPYVSPRSSPSMSPQTSPSRQDIIKVCAFQNRQKVVTVLLVCFKYIFRIRTSIYA